MSEYHLVIQFPAKTFENFDALVNFEDSLHELLDDGQDVDGHDIGSGEVNFFVFTDNPHAALDGIRTRHSDLFGSGDVRAAARHLQGEDYEVLWPAGDTSPFVII